MNTTFSLFFQPNRITDVVKFAEATMDCDQYYIEFGEQHFVEVAQIGKTRPYRIMGNYDPTNITINDDEVATMFRLKFSDIIIYESSTQNEKTIN